jgi:hypothetical protein
MSLSRHIRTRTALHIEHEPVCDRCGHGASLHTVDHGTPCVGCGERAADSALAREACRGFASEWFDNSRYRRPALAPH